MLWASLRPDNAKALECYTKAADGGNGEASHVLGSAYLDGSLGVVQDNEKARHYFERAAKLGYAESFATLGAMYANGLGVPADLPVP